MVATVQQIIGKINPKLYAKNGDALLKKYKTIDKIPAEEVVAQPLCEHVAIYDSMSDTMEPLYFFIVKLMVDFGLSPKKLIDNFVSSPGSGHFGEMGQRRSLMQQQGQKVVSDIYMLLRAILQLVYDLRDFKVRLQTYTDFKSKDPYIKESALLTLKQIWLDKVDMQKGNSSIKGMALGQAGFQTLLDAFLVARDESLKDAGGNVIDLNDRIKRVLIGRIREFNIWLMHSEDELRKRFKIQKNYLKSQVNTLKLYIRWAKPYLRAAEELSQTSLKGDKNPDLVNAFNTILLELTLFGSGAVSIHDNVVDGKFPTVLDSMDSKGELKRKYYSCVLVDFYFRGIPSKFSQRGDYAFGGRSQISFLGYALNEDELKKLEEFMGDSDVAESLRLIQGVTDDSLKEIQEDINEFLEDKDSEEKKKEEKLAKGVNPFLALLGKYDSGGNEKKEEKKEDKSGDQKKSVVIKPDNWIEKEHLRKIAKDEAVDKAFNLFDVFKKAHGMQSFT